MLPLHHHGSINGRLSSPKLCRSLNAITNSYYQRLHWYTVSSTWFFIVLILPTVSALQLSPTRSLEVNLQDDDVASNSRSLMQVAEQPKPLLQRRPPANRTRKYRSNHAHRNVIVVAVGGVAPHGRPQVTQEGHVARAGERGTTLAGGGGEKWTDCVAKDRRVFGITGDWSTAALDPGVW